MEKGNQILITTETYQKLEVIANSRNITVDEWANILLSKKLRHFQNVTNNIVRILEDPETETIKIQMPVDLPNRCKPEETEVERYIKVPLTDESREILKDAPGKR